MIAVALLFSGEKDLYVSKKVLTKISYSPYTKKNRDTGKKTNTVLKELKTLVHQGIPKNSPRVENEGKGKTKTKEAYRIWVNENLRIAGFYSDKKFIGIDYYIKKSQRNTKKITSILEKISKVKHDKEWKIVEREKL